MTKGIRDIKDIGMIARDDFLTCLSEQQKESYYSPIKKYPLDLSLKREEKEQRLNWWKPVNCWRFSLFDERKLNLCQIMNWSVFSKPWANEQKY